jgi:hypothetical protein
MEARSCTVCDGSGRSPYFSHECSACEGRKTFDPPDFARILDDIIHNGHLRRTRPRPEKGPRAYYVWRMARFHGGADVHMPMMAACMIHGDPFDTELNQLAEVVAGRAFGTDMAAAYRWCSALGHNVDVPDGLPATAYSGGPVCLP